MSRLRIGSSISIGMGIGALLDMDDVLDSESSSSGPSDDDKLIEQVDDTVVDPVVPDPIDGGDGVIP